jgi:hypothetical protein
MQSYYKTKQNKSNNNKKRKQQRKIKPNTKSTNNLAMCFQQVTNQEFPAPCKQKSNPGHLLIKLPHNGFF